MHRRGREPIEAEQLSRAHENSVAILAQGCRPLPKDMFNKITLKSITLIGSGSWPVLAGLRGFLDTLGTIDGRGFLDVTHGPYMGIDKKDACGTAPPPLQTYRSLWRRTAAPAVTEKP